MKLAEWARMNGIHPQTAYRWFREDKMPVPARRLESGTIWVDAAPADTAGRVVVYARVSSHDQQGDLDRQVARLARWATSNGHEISEVVPAPRLLPCDRTCCTRPPPLSRSSTGTATPEGEAA